MEHLRFCGSLNIACGHASERGFCTLTRCPVVLDEFRAIRGRHGPAGPKGRPGQRAGRGSAPSVIQQRFTGTARTTFFCAENADAAMQEAI